MPRLDIHPDVPLAPLTTLGLGGPAKYFVDVRSEAALITALQWAADHLVPVAILAGGSNLIVPDAGYHGLVVHMQIQHLEFDDGGSVRAGAGTPWEELVEGAISRGWGGVECLTGIPGSTGATPIQNVGAYGQEVSQIVERVRVVSRNSLEADELEPAGCGFAYRDSAFKREPDRFVVTAVSFALRPGAPPTIHYPELASSVGSAASLSDVRRAVLNLRRRKSMVLDADDPNRRSAGSFFLNPIVSNVEAARVAQTALDEHLIEDPAEMPSYPVGQDLSKLAAGWLIEKAGIRKGTRRGAVGVSTRHALSLVHHGGGTTAELLSLADEIRDRVLDRFGVHLEREPRLLV